MLQSNKKRLLWFSIFFVLSLAAHADYSDSPYNIPQPLQVQIVAFPSLFYQYMQSAGLSENQRNALDFNSEFSVSDDSVGNRTVVDLATTTTSGSCLACNVTFDKYGRATAYANGSISASFTTGSIPFGSSGSLTQDNGNFFWNDSLHLLGIGSDTPTAKIHVQGTAFAGTGTISGSSTTITGSGTSFTSQLNVNDLIVFGSQTALVTAISSNTSLSVDVALSPQPSGSSWSYEPAPMRYYEASDTKYFAVDGNGNIDIGATDTAGNAANVIQATHPATGYAGTYIQLTHGTRVGKIGVDPSNGVTFQRTDSSPVGGFGIDSSGNEFPVSTGTWGKSSARFSTGYFGQVNLTVQGSGSTPTCTSSQNGALALTSAYVLCVCNGSSWVKAADGATACTF